MTKRAPLLSLMLFAAACAGSSGRTGNRTAADQAKYDRAVESKTLLYGMTKAEVQEVLGSPGRKDSERMAGRELERWSYPKRSLDIYFDEEGFVVRWRAPFG